MAVAHLLSERRRARQEEALKQLQDLPVIEELSDTEEGEACALVGLLQAAPHKEPAAAMPKGGEYGEFFCSLSWQ